MNGKNPTIASVSGACIITLLILLPFAPLLRPGNMLFSNDGPLGEAVSNWQYADGQPWLGTWQDLSWLGSEEIGQGHMLWLMIVLITQPSHWLLFGPVICAAYLFLYRWRPRMPAVKRLWISVLCGLEAYILCFIVSLIARA